MSRASDAADTISSLDQWRHNPTSCLTRQVSGIGFQALFFYSPTYSSIHLLGLVKVLRAISMSLRFDDRASPVEFWPQRRAPPVEERQLSLLVMLQWGGSVTC
ncbi:hypothetical protein BHE74_00036070 [Ensete ventricosum]|nr:hypothetical protein BHE74_00036070 [Ensete ventricosum]